MNNTISEKLPLSLLYCRPTLFGCFCGLVSKETKAGVSGELSNELFVFRSVIFDWLQGTSLNVFGCRSKPAVYKKTAAVQSEIVALKCSCLLT